MLYKHPYKFTPNEVLFTVFANRKGFLGRDLEDEKEAYFSKGQPSFRTLPLTIRYGWGLHKNADVEIAFYGPESKQ